MEQRRWWQEKQDRSLQQRVLLFLSTIPVIALSIYQLASGRASTWSTPIYVVGLVLMTVGVTLEGRAIWQKRRYERERPTAD